MTVKSHVRWKGKKKNKVVCKTSPIFPGFCAHNHLGFAAEVSGKVGQGDRFCLDWVLWGGGQQSEKGGPK